MIQLQIAKFLQLFRKFSYTLILGFYSIAIGSVVFVAIRFLYIELHAPFDPQNNGEESVLRLNSAAFMRFEKKFIAKVVLLPLEEPLQLPGALTIKKTDFSLALFNSSRVNGQAALLKTELSNAGFRIEKIGNAETVLNTTKMRVKKRIREAEEIFKELESQIQTMFILDEEIEELEDESEYDAIIYIGKDRPAIIEGQG